MSPSQASETCASASSATSARCRVGHYANACGGCQECLSPSPPSVVLEIIIAPSISTTDTTIEVAVTMPAITSEDVCESRPAIGSATIPATVTRVVAVNKLPALLIQVRGPAPASLGHRVRRRKREHYAYYQNS